MAENVKRVNVTLPVDDYERVHALVTDGRYPSVSAFVTDAIRERLAEADAHDMLVGVLRQIGGEPTDEDRAWAADALRLADEVASGDWEWSDVA
jgi:Arc/MetJ-type ribon-helix-helix transcriptional regulator